MSDLARKKCVRGGHRGSTTKAIVRAEELLASEDPDVDRLSQLKLTLDEKLEVLKNLDAEMLDLVEDEDVAEEIDQADELKERVYVVLVKINRVLNSPSTAAERAPVSGTLPADAPSSTRGGSHVKLPKLSIQPFIGELTTWTPFWESYCAAIHGNPGLTDIEKFNYL